MKKLTKISIFIICFVAIFKLISYATTNNSGISVEQLSLSSSGLILKISSQDLNLKSIEIYKKNNNNQYVRFYKLSPDSFKEKTLSISHNKLSKNNPTDLKIVVTDENNKNYEFFLNADKLPEKTSPTPDTTTSNSPSTSTTASNSTTPSSTNSSSPSSTTSPTSNNSPAPSVDTPASISLDRTILMIDTTHYYYADLIATTSPSNSKVTWKSSNTSIATVNSKGHIVGKAFGTTTITASIQSNGKTLKATCKVRVITQPSTSKKVSININLKPTKAEIESYVNNAEKICNTTTNYTKYTEASGGKRPYYTGHSPNWGSRKWYTQKQGTISKTNYLALAFSVNQRVYLLQKKKGSWHLIATDRCTTGPITNKYHDTSPKHNRFDFYIGCYSTMSGYNGNVLFQFYDVGKSGYYLQQRNGSNLSNYKEPYYTHRAMHIGPEIDPNGKPISAGCIRLTNSFYAKLNPIVTKNLGTRLIVF